MPAITMSAPETAGRSAEIATALELVVRVGAQGDEHLLPAREGIGAASAGRSTVPMR